MTQALPTVPQEGMLDHLTGTPRPLEGYPGVRVFKIKGVVFVRPAAPDEMTDDENRLLGNL